VPVITGPSTPATPTDMGGRPVPAAPPPAVAAAARRFAAGYLPFAYGRAPASAIQGASPGLLAQLESFTPPGVPGDTPELIDVRAQALPHGAYVVTLVCRDATGQFPIDVLVERGRGGAWVVVARETSHSEAATPGIAG
jgi:hypothetical protein